MHPAFPIQVNSPAHLSLWSGVPWIIVLLGLIEFAFLYRIVTRPDFDTLNKILWVIVVIGAPVIGFALYLVASPTTLPQGTTPRAQQARHGDDLSGTPWADDPGYTRKPS